MIQRRQHAGFALESCYAFAVVTEGFRKKLDGNTAAQLRVNGLIHLSHAARTQMARDLVMCELGSDHDVVEMCGRILSNHPQATHAFEFKEGKSMGKASIGRGVLRRSISCTLPGRLLP